MYTRERLLGLRNWAYDNFCKGRLMKAPSRDMKVTEVVRQEPCCYVGWAPARPDTRFQETVSAAPGLLIMPGQGSAMSYDANSSKPASAPLLSQTLAVSFLMCVYEPGIRLPGFDGNDYALIYEATQQGLFTLTDWMDELKETLLAEKIIPGTDLILSNSDVTYSLYSEQGYVADKRPLFYGYVNAVFNCHTQGTANKTIQDMLL